MKEYVEDILRNALELLGIAYPSKVVIEAPKHEEFGDIATNIAMVLAKECKKNPIHIAQDIVPHIASCDDIAHVHVAGAGFINISFTKAYWHAQFLALEHAPLFESKRPSQRVLIEFVSANPTGPLHVGHARGAAFGDALRRVFEYAGYNVDTEYYVNDAGNQMRMLGYSVYLRLRELHGMPTIFPDEYYRGEYIIDIARTVDSKFPSLYTMNEEDAIVQCQHYATESIVTSIKEDLLHFRVEHSQWFYESTLVQGGGVEEALSILDEKGVLYEEDGALWFRSTAFGDDKDRVVKRNDGSYTYFASDIAYHVDKIRRGYTLLFDVLGADHHGYVKRLEASVHALAAEQVVLTIPLIQLVSLVRDGLPISMSTRAGTFETLNELIEEVGVDAARFMFLSRRNDSPLEFDLDLVTKKTMDNPVYYVQYAHARIHSLVQRYYMEVSQENIYETTVTEELAEVEEIALIKHILAFQECIEGVIRNGSPHSITQYLTTMAELFHRYYARYPLCSSHNPARSCMRLRLCIKVQECIATALALLGVSAPEEM